MEKNNERSMTEVWVKKPSVERARIGFALELFSNLSGACMEGET